MIRRSNPLSNSVQRNSFIRSSSPFHRRYQLWHSHPPGNNDFCISNNIHYWIRRNANNGSRILTCRSQMTKFWFSFNISPYTFLNEHDVTYINSVLGNESTKREPTNAFSNGKIWSYNIFGINQKYITNI